MKFVPNPNAKDAYQRLKARELAIFREREQGGDNEERMTFQTINERRKKEMLEGMNTYLHYFEKLS